MPKLSVRHALLATLASISLLTTGCSGAATATAPAAADLPSTTAPTPEAGPSRQLAVAGAPEGRPTTAARSGRDGQARKSPLKVASYDRTKRRAVISTEGTGTSPQKPAEKAPAVGDIIASGPAPGAPDGLLAKVTDVAGKTSRGTEVATEPATLGALLGDDTARGTVPVDPAAVEVEPLVEGVKVSWAKKGNVHVGPQGAKVPLGSLRIDVGASVPLPVTEGAPVAGAASVAGHVQLAPEVEFSYDGSSALSPDSAFLGLSGRWSSGWELKGKLTAGNKPVRIPFAKLHADPVIQVGPVPVVVNLDLTVYVQVAADGSVSVEVAQDLEGGFRVGGGYTKAEGWQPVSTSDMTGTPVRAKVTAAGKVKAALGAEASIGLYGAVGVSADLAPYLRGEAAASATPGSAVGSWKLYGGVDLSGWLQLQLSVFGTPVFQHRIPLGTLNREWPLASGEAALA
ncbi:hypothetical protein [Streptomyces sp. AM8-1-1]|uniref:hypothetical protein n=1 Tax=Streptomyces sp. AM8-1-1 TaxID=3075825 RepID=UPI0028C446E3|nr:hypothetical protein [Streptomyces sp. AM8-1-1]WNO74048.1 hypothetical protein RPQ07_21545 [Streptomyces sp. AM8-1-1]